MEEADRLLSLDIELDTAFTPEERELMTLR